MPDHRIFLDDDEPWDEQRDGDYPGTGRMRLAALVFIVALILGGMLLYVGWTR